MVKADLTRDYYGDLELQPTADPTEIKKQFKKLGPGIHIIYCSFLFCRILANFQSTALLYHPDRNPGREEEVTAKFQKIQSAHEVLTDTQEKAKYDANRGRGSSAFRNNYSAAPAGRGNPWSNVSAQYPPPPKPPTARRPPPASTPSSGARRYEKFATPGASASSTYQAAQEGPQARKSTYEAAWENMRHPPKTENGQGKTRRAPQPPPRSTQQTGHEESNAKTYAPPPRPRFGFEEFATNHNSQQRNRQSTNVPPPVPNRTGFMPNTPGGDEAPAPRGNYFTARDKPTAPPVPPREPPPTMNGGPDPLKQFREKAAMPSKEPHFGDAMPSTEPRISTPYANHGSEKFNPYDTTNLSRSKSTHDRSDASDSQEKSHVPRTASGSHSNNPPHDNSFASRPGARKTEVNFDSSSSDEQAPKTSFHSSARRSTGPSMKQETKKTTDTTAGSETTSKQTHTRNKLSRFQKWFKETGGQEHIPDDYNADGPPPRSGQAQSDTSGKSTMYGTVNSHSVNPQKRLFSFHSSKGKLPTVSETITSSSSNGRSFSNDSFYQEKTAKYPNLFQPIKLQRSTPPSGASASPQSLNAFEAMQNNIVDQLLVKKTTSSSDKKLPFGSSSHPTKLKLVPQGQNHPLAKVNGPHRYLRNTLKPHRGSIDAGSPSKKPRRENISLHFVTAQSQHHPPFAFFNGSDGSSDDDDVESLVVEEDADMSGKPRFSFPLHDDTFNQTQPRRTFSSSAENISTNFNPDDWNGKFAAGAEYFQPDPKTTTSTSRRRGQSASRTRTQSPMKVRTTDPQYMPPAVETEGPLESPGGTKFSAEQWAETFKPQTFMPAPTPSIPSRPGRKRTGPTLRTTLGGNAAVVDDGESTDTSKPLYSGRKNVRNASPKASKVSSRVASPEPMDVDTPPAASFVPEFATADAERTGIPKNTVPQFAPSVSTYANDQAQTKRPAEDSISQSSNDMDALKVNFEDFKIKDLITAAEIPARPPPPFPPAFPTHDTLAAYSDYTSRFEKYMLDWDLYDKRFMLHLVARKNQNDVLLANRWNDKQCAEIYREGLKYDAKVLGIWAESKVAHEGVMRQWLVVNEKMGELGVGERPITGSRKKMH